jgi:hypothetical protein
MQYRTLLLAAATLLSAYACNNAPSSEKIAATPAPTVIAVPTATEVWTTDTTSLKTPESVIFDAKSGLLYVACIGGTPPDKADKDGYIAQVDLTGKVVNAKWITGLDAPKGMGIKDDMLFVTDIDELVGIQISTSKIVLRVPVKDAKFLNDIDIAADGKVYFTDSGDNSILTYDGKSLATFLKDTALLKGPNGLLCEGQTLHIATFGNGVYMTTPMVNPALKVHTDSLGGGDGVERYKDGLLISDWSGRVFFIDKNYKKHTILDTKAAKRNAADIEYVTDKNLMLVPEFFANRVTAYSLK